MRKAVVAAFLLILPAALAQAQNPPQGIPGTLPAAPPVIVPPPPVAPPQVPSVVTPLPQPSYGIPPGVTAPVYSGSGVTPSIRYRQPPRRHKKRRPRSSGIELPIA